MQHAAFMQVAHAASDVVRDLKHSLDACEGSAEAAQWGDTPGQDCMLQQQRGQPIRPWRGAQGSCQGCWLHASQMQPVGRTC